jgi:hypothetical protein
VPGYFSVETMPLESASMSNENTQNEDEDGDGNCFLVAAQLVMDANLRGFRTDNLFTCHGTVSGQEALLGTRFIHAWVELETDAVTIVIDQSNGNNIVMPREAYYRLGEIDTDTVRRFTSGKTIDNLLRTGHYGPWETTMTATELAELISQYQFNFIDEKDIQRGLFLVFQNHDIKQSREKFISECDRPDFLMEGGIAIEVKTGGTLNQLTRQIHRYAQHEAIREIIVVTPCAKLTRLPREISGKPVTVVNVARTLG